MGQTNSTIPRIKVLVDGKADFASPAAKPLGQATLTTANGLHITRLHVDKRLDSPDMFTLDYHLLVGPDFTFIDSFKEGHEVEIHIGYQKEVLIFKGEVSYIEPHYTKDGNGTLTLSGYDRTHRLTRGSRSKSWDDRASDAFDYATVVNDVINKSGSHDDSAPDDLAPGEMGETPPKFRHIPQLNMNDYQFVKSLGIDFGLKAGSTAKEAKKVSFRKIGPSDNAVVTIVRDKLEGTNPHIASDVRFKLSTVKQVNRVEVRGWDPKNKKNIVGVAETPTLNFPGTKAHEATGQALYGSAGKGRKVVVVDHPVYSKDEADKVAQAIFDSLSMEFVTGEAEIEGEPTLNPGDTIEVKQFGERFSGKYLVTGVQQLFIPDVLPYVTRLEFARNAINDAS